MKRQPSQTRGIVRVNHILDACEALLGDRRYEDISTDDIIETADVARGTLYHFFENRRAVFLAVMHRALMEIDEQTNPRPGEDKLAFIDYVFKVECRLEKVWQKRRNIVEFYESNKFSPDFDKPRRQEHTSSIDVMARELRSRHPDVDKARARTISITVLQAMYSGLDTVSLYQSYGATGAKLEWFRMITAYIESLELSAVRKR